MANSKRRLGDDDIKRFLEDASNGLEAPSDSDLSIIDSDEDDDDFSTQDKEELLDFLKNEARNLSVSDSIDLHPEIEAEDPTVYLPDDVTPEDSNKERMSKEHSMVIQNYDIGLPEDLIEVTDYNETLLAGNTYIVDLRQIPNIDHNYVKNYSPTLPSTSTSNASLLSTSYTTDLSVLQHPTKPPNLTKNKRETKKRTCKTPRPTKNKTENTLKIKNAGKDNRKTKDLATWFPGKDNHFVNNVPLFLGEEAVNIDGETPADFFSQLFPDEIFDIIVTESMRYAFEQGKNNFRLSKGDLKIYFGINIIMTYIKYMRCRMYWSSISALRMDLIADSMSVNRFEEIKRFLHFVNNADKEELKENRFWKIRPIADILHRTFHEAKSEEENQSVDEMIVPFKGRNSLKQYLKKKPKKWGFKIWVKAGASGYVNCFELYQGASKTPRSVFGPTGDSVIRICHDIEGKNHKLFMDNFFITMALVRHLKSKGILLVGTVQMCRVPNEAKVHLVDPDLLPRGGSSIVTSSDNISIVRWKDNNAVHTISTYARVEPGDKAVRWDKITKERLDVPRPYSIQEYNMFMGGVDLVDRMIAHYPHGFKNKRWYLRVFFHLMNVAILNSWHLYKLKKGIPNYSLLYFKASLATSLISSATMKKRGRPSEDNLPSVKKRTVPPKISLEVRYDGMNHYPKKTQAKQALRCHDKHCKSRTRYICEKCDEPVCPDCMKRFHTK